MNIRRLRKFTQVSALALIFAIPLLNRAGITTLMGTFYSLAVGPLWITDPLMGIQVILTTLAADRSLLISMTFPVVITLALGKAFCGWVCPQNTLSEFIDYAAARLGIKRPFGRKTSAIPRYTILAVVIILTPVMKIPLAGFLSSQGILSVQVTKLIFEGIVGLELALVLCIGIFELLLVRRGWCNYICPAGSLLGILRFKKTLKVAFNEDADHVCGKCMECADACRLGLNPMKGGIYPQCHNCGACISACEKIKAEKKPLAFRF